MPTCSCGNFFNESVVQKDMRGYFRQGVRTSLGCRLLGLYEEADWWSAQDLHEHEQDNRVEVPWRDFYTKYVCALSRMTTEVTRVHIDAGFSHRGWGAGLGHL